MTPLSIPSPAIRHQVADVNGIRLHYAMAGRGEALLLLHGWPFTWYTWRLVLPALAQHYTVVMPDLRGIGQTSRPATGYDSRTRAADAAGLLHYLGFEQAYVMGHDLGVEIAFMTALVYPQLVRKLVLSEAIVGGLPGAEEFLQRAPWWFSFHAVPDLPEQVIPGQEELYLNWFYQHSTYQQRGIAPEARAEYVAAYTGTDALRGAFQHYRAFPENRRQVAEALAQGLRLTCPTLAVCGNVVGEVLFNQLGPVTDSLETHLVPECGHVVQEEQPEHLQRVLLAFLAGAPHGSRERLAEVRQEIDKLDKASPGV
ncbi:alpha/beta hydrolase [Hymenobacter sp. YC55]|uniref:alpha/beta fold hydrolase n=1 Tax=Hymenobacter sp. YC55 TaxID=3034019 RepID=UPI0023FA127D|nr:alpha/beta hydrolase [Hymenobacter sp. YC55]MDF7815855.1 alpha/beta hydrolase [Hymenobacter sp. YC55]